MARARIRGITIAYDDEGSGYPLLLFHGHPFNRRMWAPQLRAASSHHRIIVPDLRGYGETDVTPGRVLLDEMALDAAVLLDALEIERVLVGGLSMGGQIALDFIRLFPHRVSGLLIAASSAQAEAPDGVTRRNSMAARLEQEGMARYAREEIHKFFSQASMEHQPGIVADVRRMMEDTNPDGAAAALRGRAIRRDHAGHLRHIAVPTLIVVGTEDQFTTVADAELLATIPGSRLVVFPDVGHMPNLEAADLFNTELLAWAERASREKTSGMASA